MASLPTLFEDFLGDIRPTDGHIQDYKDGHETLRARLESDDNIQDFHVADFLQGSYRRWTAVKPVGDEKSDVDIILVTNLDKEKYSPAEAMGKCEPFLDEYYAGQWERNARSYKIDAGSVEIDLVLTAAPAEAAKAAIEPEGSIGALDVGAALSANQSETIIEALGLTFGSEKAAWRDEPLDIPDWEWDAWDKTHPLETLAWTVDKNYLTDSHYVNVVKALKWWRRVNELESERPKGYPLEHIIGHCCPDRIEGVAEGVTRTLERFVTEFQNEAITGTTPTLPAHGLPQKNVLERIAGDEFARFYSDAARAAEVARDAFEAEDPEYSSQLWRQLFGEEFPEYTGSTDDGEDQGQAAQFRSSSKSTSVSDQRFA